MRAGLIYKYTNKINGKIYIGQTSQRLELRNRKHLEQMKNGCNTLFHRALRKYGRDNFDLIVLEDICYAIVH